MNKNIYDLLNKHNLDKNTILTIADLIVNNNLIIKYNYIPKSLDNIEPKLNITDDFNWKIDLDTHSNMAMLHLHAWEPISYLFLAHYQTENQRYLDKGIKLIESWKSSSTSEEHKFLWYPHCVADRSIVLGYLKSLNESVQNIENKLLNQLINQHIKFLKDEKNYVHFNHGTMIDCSLILLSILEKDDDTLMFAIKRVRENFLNTFTDNMICVENSITYSVYNIELFVLIQKNLLNSLNIDLIPDLDSKIWRALDFINILKQPNNTFPLYGDGELITIDSLKSKYIYNYYPEHPVFSFYNTNNLESYYYEIEGYLIIKDKNKYFFVRSGDMVKNHKHPDDLSFVLYYDKEFLVDTGIYNYDTGLLNDYFKSSKAHNSVVLEDENYPYINNKAEETSISYYKEYTDYFYVILKNNSYKFANILRHIYIFKDTFTVLISDNINCPFNIKNSQFFNLSPEICSDLFVNFNNHSILLNNRILIQSISQEKSNFISRYSKESIVAKKYHDLQNTVQLEFSSHGPNCRLTTLISFDIENDILKTLRYSNQKITFNNFGKNYSLNFYNKNDSLNMDKYIHFEKIQDKLYYLQTYYNGFEDKDYAWYIYLNNRRIDIIWYQPSAKFQYEFKESGDYRIRCFVRNRNNKSEKKEFSIKKRID